MAKSYYNENNKFLATWLQNLISDGLISDGDVDNRDIRDVSVSDLEGYTQCHFFAGIGGWSYAARLAGWPDSRPMWTASCPCQPFSSNGNHLGFEDERHLWPTINSLARIRKPSVIFGEQSARASDWIKLVRSDLEKMGFAMGAVPIEAASAGARHRRDRYYFVAHPHDSNTNGRDCSVQMGWVGDQIQTTQDGLRTGIQWPSQPRPPTLAYGVPSRLEQVNAYGNAIVPQLAAKFIRAYMMSQY